MYAKGPSLSRKGDKQVMYDGMVPGETGYLASMVCVGGGGGVSTNLLDMGLNPPLDAPP